MAGGAAQPTVCYQCGTKPEYNKQGWFIGNWEYKTRKEGKQIIWFTLCPVCREE